MLFSWQQISKIRQILIYKQVNKVGQQYTTDQSSWHICIGHLIIKEENRGK